MDVKSGKANLFIQAQQATSTEAKITEEKKTTAPLAPVVTVIAEKKVSVAIAPLYKAESQLSATATQAQLSNRLDQKFKTDFAQKKTAMNPLPKNAEAERGGQLRDGSVRIAPPWVEQRNAWDAAKRQNFIPTTLFTGDGNDKVDIYRNADPRNPLVIVKVNGKETWSGTEEEFRYLTINTGDGDDVVNNTVDGATILTGAGNDTVNLGAYYPSSITLWFPKTYLSDENVVDTGSGNDRVNSMGSKNIIRTGSGDDTVISSIGTGNTISTGEGHDTVKANTVSILGEIPDKIYDPDGEVD